MKLYFKFFILLFLTVNSYAQSRIIDSLKIELNKELSDSLKASVLNNLAYNYLYHSVDSSLVYGKKLQKLAFRMKSKSYKVISGKSIGQAFLYLNKNDSAQTYLEEAFKVAETNMLDMSALYTTLGQLYKRQGDYEKAIKAYLDGVNYDDGNKENYGKFIKLMNIGNVHIVLKDYHKAIEYNKKALSLLDSIKNERINMSVGMSYNNIGTSYAYLKDYENSLVYFKKALAINLKNENKKEIANNYMNIGSVYRILGDTKNAVTYLTKANTIAEKLSTSERLQIDLNIALGTNYSSLKQYNKSEIHYAKALNLAKEIENLPLISQAYLVMSSHYSSINKTEKAFTNYKEHIKFKDSIFKINNVKSLQDIETKYETEKKDNEIASQKLQLQEQENDMLKKQNQYSLALGGGVFLLLGSLGLWLFYRQRQKIKNNEILALQSQQDVVKLESLIDGEEKERNRLAQDLHDGINGDLAVIKYKISSLEPSKFSKKEKTFYDDAIGMLDNAVEQVRRISHNLAPPSLQNFDLIEAIQQFCSKQNASNLVNISFQYFGNRLSLKKENETAIYRIIQELLNNIIKHANATEALVQLNNHDDKLIITVEDNGQGFDTNNSETGIGLQNIKSRVNYLKANLDINSSKKGTTFSIEIDVTKMDKN